MENPKVAEQPKSAGVPAPPAKGLVADKMKPHGRLEKHQQKKGTPHDKPKESHKPKPAHEAFTSARDKNKFGNSAPF
jgi:hypothetical protein